MAVCGNRYKAQSFDPNTRFHNRIYPGVYGYLGQYFTNAYQIDSSNNVTTNIAGMLSPYGQFFATVPGPAALETMPDIDTGQQGTGIVYCVSLQVDKNHDGVMDTNYFGEDTTSQSSPMEFWINNDNDGTGIGEDIDTPTDPDSGNEVIQSMRDLEDFARLWICGLPVLPYDYQVTLSWANISSGNPSIKIFPSRETDGGTEYLTDTNLAQNYVGNPLTEPCYGTVTNGENFQFPDLYFTEGGDKYLIFEGVTPGTGELLLTIKDNNSNTIAQTGVWLDLHDVRDFYEREIITNNISGAISNWSSSIELVQQGLTLIAVVLVGLALFLYLNRHSIPKSNEVGALSNGVPTPKINSNQQAAEEANSSVAGGSETQSKAGPTNIAQPETNSFFKHLEPEWQIPIDFYGEVLDESNKPVANATVQFDWTETPAEALSGPGEAKTVFSDTSGLFELHGAKGPSLSVAVSKKGYYTSQSNPWAFSYTGSSPFSPNPSSPIIFHLRMKGTPVPLMRLAGVVLGPRQYRLDPEGVPTDISFYTGKRVPAEESQFHVALNVSIAQIPGQRQFNWQCQISIPNGGLLATSDEFPFLAPEQGYQETVEIDSNTNSWSDRFVQNYYVHLPDGKYGRVKFNLSCRSSPYFGVEALINFEGSKDLEYDKYLPGNIMVDHSAP